MIAVRSSSVGFVSLVFLLVAVPSAAAQKEGSKKGGDEFKGYRSFSQTEYGGGEDGNPQARQALNEGFEAAFPKGAAIGTRGGHMFVVESADDVRSLLPQDGPPRPMKEGGRKGFKDAGGLAGQLLAAKLNVGLDRVGALGHREKADQPPLGSMVVRRGVQRALRGLTVGEIIRLGDQAVGGELGNDKPEKKLIDVDGDDDADVSLMDLREALHEINVNFKHGRDDGGKSLGHDEDDDDAEAMSAAEEEAIERLEEQRDEQLARLEEQLEADIVDIRKSASRANSDEERAALKERFATIKSDYAKARERVLEDHAKREAEVRAKYAAEQAAEDGGGKKDKEKKDKDGKDKEKKGKGKKDKGGGR